MQPNPNCEVFNPLDPSALISILSYLKVKFSKTVDAAIIYRKRNKSVIDQINAIRKNLFDPCHPCAIISI